MRTISPFNFSIINKHKSAFNALIFNPMYPTVEIRSSTTALNQMAVRFDNVLYPKLEYLSLILQFHLHNVLLQDVTYSHTISDTIIKKYENNPFYQRPLNTKDNTLRTVNDFNIIDSSESGFFVANLIKEIKPLGDEFPDIFLNISSEQLAVLCIYNDGDFFQSDYYGLNFIKLYRKLHPEKFNDEEFNRGLKIVNELSPLKINTLCQLLIEFNNTELLDKINNYFEKLNLQKRNEIFQHLFTTTTDPEQIKRLYSINGFQQFYESSTPLKISEGFTMIANVNSYQKEYLAKNKGTFHNSEHIAAKLEDFKLALPVQDSLITQSIDQVIFDNVRIIVFVFNRNEKIPLEQQEELAKMCINRFVIEGCLKDNDITEVFKTISIMEQHFLLEKQTPINTKQTNIKKF